MAMARTRARGWWYPLIFVGGMLVVIVVNGIMMYFATTTFTGIETENPYEKGLTYNKTLAESRAQADMGWTVNFAFDPATGGTVHGGRLTLAYRDRDGKPLDAMQVEARIVRPTSAHHDRILAVSETAPGVYGVTLDQPLPGIWDVHLTARRGKQIHRDGHRIQVP